MGQRWPYGVCWCEHNFVYTVWPTVSLWVLTTSLLDSKVSFLNCSLLNLFPIPLVKSELCSLVRRKSLTVWKSFLLWLLHFAVILKQMSFRHLSKQSHLWCWYSFSVLYPEWYRECQPPLKTCIRTPGHTSPRFPLEDNHTLWQYLISPCLIVFIRVRKHPYNRCVLISF